MLTTSYTLMQAIKSAGDYDLILCGKQTTDGDTAQVSGALAKVDGHAACKGWVGRNCKVLQNAVEVRYNMDSRTLSAMGCIALPAVCREGFLPCQGCHRLNSKSVEKERDPSAGDS